MLRRALFIVHPLCQWLQLYLFFHLFFIANFCLFSQKGKSSVLTALQLYLFVCLFLSPSSFYYAGNPYASFLRIWRQYISSLHIRISTTMSLPPHGMPSHSGQCGNMLSITISISVAIAVSVVPFSVDCCISPHYHCCCRRCLCHLAAAMAVAIAATAAIAFAVTAAAVITAAINATATVAVVAHNCCHSCRWLSALALSAGSQRMASARGFSACHSALGLIAWLS